MTKPVLDLFSAAAGGWSLGMHRAGYRTVAACEVIDWRRTLYSENNPGVPVYDDVTTLTADRLVRDGIERPYIVVGSPPCQDISSANTKGKGVDGERSGLYFEAVRLIDECRPRWYALENSANLRTRGADRVIAALEAIGYTCWPFVVSAGDVGANHPRKRSWLIGYNARDTHSEPSAAWLRPASNEGEDDERGGRFRSDPKPRRNGPLHNADTASVGHEGWWARGCGSNGDSSASVVPEARGQGQSDSAEHGQMGGCPGIGPTPPEPWADWNGGLTHHLRVDDGLSGWVAQSRIAIGGPKGTVAASLIVEAFGDAVVPQIPEAIGRAITRVDAALSAIHGATAPAVANDNARTVATTSEAA